jgi:hypothetical protein
MSYAMGGALQEAVFARLSGDAAVAAATGGAIYDALPRGPVPKLYVSLGAEQVRDRSAADAGLAAHDFEVSVVSDAAGFAEAKAVAGAVSEALVAADLALSRGRLLTLRFLKARARRVDRGRARRIDLRFRAIVADD